MVRPPAAVCRPILAERHPPLARYKKRGVLAAGDAERRGAELGQRRSGAERTEALRVRSVPLVLRVAGSAGRAARRGALLCRALSRCAGVCPAAAAGAAAHGGASRHSQHGAAYQPAA